MTSPRRQVYIAYTGGTIGMRRTDGRYEPDAGYLAEQMDQLPQLRGEEVPEYTVGEYEPLLDSANMSPSHWMDIAEDIRDHYADFDGFVVLHGTDTMAYTASALSFVLEGLAKPVVLTGSQLPLMETRSDARENLVSALVMAGNFDIPEVCLLFDHHLLRGNRAVKVNSEGFGAFASPNCEPLGWLGVSIELNHGRILPPPDRPFRVQSVGQATVGAFRIFPGLKAEYLKTLLKPPLQGLVLETFGVGNGPTQDREFLAVLDEATARGVVIVDTTQCLRGRVDLQRYRTGSALADAGVVSGFDMTAEAALAKLFYLFGKGLSSDRVREEMVRNLRGELTLPLSSSVESPGPPPAGEGVPD
jgi:L-asparaginase